LSYNTTEEDILNMFKQAGNVVSCQLILDKITRKSRGFAFVEMGSQEDANKAIAQFNGKELDGRALKVTEHRPHEDRPHEDRPRETLPREDRPRGGFGDDGGSRRVDRKRLH
jgi:RNA recognition motif-containing protein